MSQKTLNCFIVQPLKKLFFPDLDSNQGLGSAAGHTPPATGVKKGETTLSEIKTVQVLILN
jgi:hypothetical protein